MIKEIISHIDKGKLNEALIMLEEVLDANAYDIQAMSLKASVLYKLKEYQESISMYSSLINLVPNDPDNYAGRGLSHHFNGEMKFALADFDKAIELDPSNGYRYSSRAFIKEFYGDTNGALEDYNKALELDPEDAISLNNIGVIHEKKGRFDKAIQSFDKSDKISGIDVKSIKLPIMEESLAKRSNGKSYGNESNEKQDSNPYTYSNKKHSTGVQHFFKILKRLFTSANERRNFYRFLFRK